MPTKRNSRAPVNGRDGEVTRHELAIRMLVNGDSGVHRNGFKAAVCELWQEAAEPDEDGLIEDVPDMPFLPDAYKVDRERKLLMIYEVEDSHPIPPRKLQEYAMFWFYWDCEETDWEPRLYAVDRYGTCATQINLQALYYACLDSFRPSGGGAQILAEIERLSG